MPEATDMLEEALTKLRRESAELNLTKSRRETALPVRIKPLMDRLLPREAMSSVDMLPEISFLPRTLRPVPIRAKLRIDRLLPKCEWLRTEIALPALQ
jgi:hypothetical protein